MWALWRLVSHPGIHLNFKQVWDHIAASSSKPKMSVVFNLFWMQVVMSASPIAWAGVTDRFVFIPAAKMTYTFSNQTIFCELFFYCSGLAVLCFVTLWSAPAILHATAVMRSQTVVLLMKFWWRSVYLCFFSLTLTSCRPCKSRPVVAGAAQPFTEESIVSVYCPIESFENKGPYCRKW